MVNNYHLARHDTVKKERSTGVGTSQAAKAPPHLHYPTTSLCESRFVKAVRVWWVNMCLLDVCVS